ncbi:uncharacterized protein ARMOST_01176 [Armillaria ostoyae]|uniref:Uncharacterized protein n=1 Tax=Armillaria ostoyae TaxID=47428 RepID=A0A284QNB6_ARMOS|nr:uncharacterized protein ARMOST_01176 [Armillaria ostoyae]
MKPSCSRKDLSEGFPVTTTVPSVLISTLELICEGISDGPPANYEPQLEIPGEDGGLGEDAMDIDMWERQGERDKNLTLQEADLDSCTLLIAQALFIFASLWVFHTFVRRICAKPPVQDKNPCTWAMRNEPPGTPSAREQEREAWNSHFFTLQIHARRPL